MNIIKIKDIIHKEIAIEMRQKSAVMGIFLFAATTVFLIYKTYNSISPREWSILIWITLLFAGLNAIVKSFVQERKETYRYYYTLFDPIDLLIGKVVYNYCFLVLVYIAINAFYALFTGFPIKDLGLYMLGSLVGIFGVAIVFTFISIIPSQEGSSATLLSILALPLVLPFAMILVKVTSISARLMVDTTVYDDIWIMFGLDSLLLGTAIILFPTLWRS